MSSSETSVGKRTTTGSVVVRIAVLSLMALTAIGLTSARAEAGARSSADDRIVAFHSSLIDSDDDHDDASGEISRWGYSVWDEHHCVWGGGSQLPYTCDGSYDFYADDWREQWVVTPFGSRTVSGDDVVQTVTTVQLACASGRYADGGYRVEILASNARTGEALGVAQIAHIKNVDVEVGDTIGPWTRIGEPDGFDFNNNSSCYQVTNDAGVHLHIEIVGATNYSCMDRDTMQESSISEIQRHGWVNTPAATSVGQWC